MTPLRTFIKKAELSGQHHRQEDATGAAAEPQPPGLGPQSLIVISPFAHSEASIFLWL